MQKILGIFFMAAFLFLLGACQASRANRPKTSATAPRIDAGPRAGILAPQTDSLKLALIEREILTIKKALERAPDSLHLYINIVQQVDCPALVGENKKLKKKVTGWRIAAGVILFLATGQVLLNL